LDGLEGLEGVRGGAIAFVWSTEGFVFRDNGNWSFSRHFEFRQLATRESKPGTEQNIMFLHHLRFVAAVFIVDYISVSPGGPPYPAEIPPPPTYIQQQPQTTSGIRRNAMDTIP
jgi:hypothetical protein